MFGFAVASGLEASKVLAIVLYRILREQIIERITCGFDWLVDADIRSFFDSIPIWY